ncbi:hypothetical protein ACQBAR_11715 [Propionibacteriaceae bacterium Y1685]
MVTQRIARTAFGRRAFLGGSLSAAALAGLAACGGGGGGGNSGGDSWTSQGPAAAPAYVPFVQVEPDLEGNAEGLPDGYFQYPSDPVKREEFPLSGGEPIRFMGPGTAPANSGPEKNAWWKQLAEQTGSEWQIQNVPFLEYSDKLDVTMASGDIPDLVQLAIVPQFPKLLDKYFTDLSSHLEGDKIKKYPGLASIPTAAWEAASLNGRIFGLPQPRYPLGRIISTRGATLKEKGIEKTPTIANGEEFRAMLTELSNPKEGKFALGQQPTTWFVPAVAEMLGAPNKWREEGGKFTHWYETEEYAAAIQEVKKWWEAKLIHPEAFNDQSLVWLEAGTISVYMQSVAGWSQYATEYPDWDLGMVVTPKFEGGGPAVKHLGPASYSAFIGVKAGSEERVDQILKAVDYLASPFGTTQYLEAVYGVEGKHYDFKGSDPVVNKGTKADSLGGIRYLTQATGALYVPGQKEVVQEQYDIYSKLLPTGEQDASQGLYSENAVTGSTTASKKLTDTQNEIIQGRKTMKDWETALKDWKTSNDKTRGEYEESFAKKQGG